VNLRFTAIPLFLVVPVAHTFAEGP
jgi:hypothetical protein